MRRIFGVVLAFGFLALAGVVSPASAQATRTWVSGVGDDANPCSRTAPCKTFAGAISKTAVNGEINCIDPGGFGAVTITKSITLDCKIVEGSILATGTNGIIINIPVGASGDPLRTVRIRGLSINGTGSAAQSGLKGINIIAASVVYVEDTVISDFTQHGLLDARNSAGKLFVLNSIFRNNTGPGIAAIGTVATNFVVLDNVKSENNTFGLATATLNIVTINRSVFAGNGSAGVEADPGAQVYVTDSIVSNNNIGVQSGGSNIRLSNSSIVFNTTGITGTTFSFGTNRIAGNTSAGVAPTAAGAASSALGQQ